MIVAISPWNTRVSKATFIKLPMSSAWTFNLQENLTNHWTSRLTSKFKTKYLKL